jgi:cytochrome c oxidase subunit 4
MSADSHGSHKKEYFMVFLALGVLTALELFVPGMKGTTLAKGSLLTCLAIIKAFLVAYFFMHLKMEKRWLQGIAAIPISAALYALFVCLESMYR